MDDAYDTALRDIADAYEAQVSLHGGKSLARVATIVLSSGAFFQRLREGKPFLTKNLDKLASYFRNPANWPVAHIPIQAVLALQSIGREPYEPNVTHCHSATSVETSSFPSADFPSLTPTRPVVRCDQAAASHPRDAA